MTDLLPCPFCGCAPAVYPLDPKTEGDAWAQVGCENPECEGVCVHAYDEEDPFGAAYAKWNRRFPIPAPISEEAVERAARAIAGLTPAAFRGLGTYQQEDYRRAARRVLSTPPPPAESPAKVTVTAETVQIVLEEHLKWTRTPVDGEVHYTLAGLPEAARAVMALIGEPAKVTVDDVRVPLADCPIGLFLADDGTLCLKTEYGSNEGRIDAYIVSSGEFFWGQAPQTIARQRAQMVTPVTLSTLPPPAIRACPEGWVMVPREATEAMMAVTGAMAGRGLLAAGIWAAMIAAAPPPPAESPANSQLLTDEPEITDAPEAPSLSPPTNTLFRISLDYVDDVLRAELVSTLTAIGRTARSDGGRTFDDCIRDLAVIDDLARAVMDLINGSPDTP